jgi:hypothetical protein
MENVGFPIFMATWVVLGIVGFFAFIVSKDVQFKRKYHPWFVVLSGILFAGFGFLMFFPAWPVLVFLPFLVLILYLSIKLTKFCPNCAATNYNHMIFSSSMNCCRKCGSPFDAEVAIRHKAKPYATAFILEIAENGKFAIIGVFSSHEKAQDFLKDLPKRHSYILTKVPMDERIAQGTNIEDGLGAYNHWHYGKSEVEYAKLDDEGNIVEQGKKEETNWPE